jgi:hypothetical protein
LQAIDEVAEELADNSIKALKKFKQCLQSEQIHQWNQG